MNYSFLLENQQKRRELSVGQVLCFAMFCFWQMGFIYFLGPALNIDGRTPLPIDMDNVTTLIAACYVLSILFMIFLPRFVVLAERVCTAAALCTALGLFLPLSEGLLRMLIYGQVFFCCLMIGFETFVIVNFFSEKSAILALTVGYGLAVTLIAAVQNDFLPITFPVFRMVIVAALIFLLLFFFQLPSAPGACPRYVKKDSGLVAPKKMIVGTYALVFVAALMGVSGPSLAGGIRHGVFVAYGVDAAVSLLIWLLWRRAKIHPFRSISVCMSLGCVGFLLMYASDFLPSLTYLSCILIGFGMMTCQMLPLYILVLMKSYPSRYLSPLTIFLALVAVLVQSSLVELFRAAPAMLSLAYAVIMVILVTVYLQIEPFFMYSLHRRFPKVSEQEQCADEAYAQRERSVPESPAEELPASPVEEPQEAAVPEDSPLADLSKRELEVVDLIASGYRNAEIASILYISVHTVNDHTKKIYRKLDVHSRLEVAALVSRCRTKE